MVIEMLMDVFGMTRTCTAKPQSRSGLAFMGGYSAQSPRDSSSSHFMFTPERLNPGALNLVHPAIVPGKRG